MVQHAGLQECVQVLRDGLDTARERDHERIVYRAGDGARERGEGCCGERGGEEEVDNAGCGAVDERRQCLYAVRYMA